MYVAHYDQHIEFSVQCFFFYFTVRTTTLTHLIHHTNYIHQRNFILLFHCSIFLSTVYVNHTAIKGSKWQERLNITVSAWQENKSILDAARVVLPQPLLSRATRFHNYNTGFRQMHKHIPLSSHWGHISIKSKKS